MAPYSMDLRKRVVKAWDAMGDADAVAAIARPRPDACGSRIIVIGDISIAVLATRVIEGAIDRLPGFFLRPLDPDGTAGAMKIALRIAIIFELAIKRQNLREAPFGVAPRAPLVKILRRPAERDMAIDSGGATHHPPARLRRSSRARTLRLSGLFRVPVLPGSLFALFLGGRSLGGTTGQLRRACTGGLRRVGPTGVLLNGAPSPSAGLEAYDSWRVARGALIVAPESASSRWPPARSSPECRTRSRSAAGPRSRPGGFLPCRRRRPGPRRCGG